MNHLETSKQTKLEAEEILNQTKLITLLNKYGEVRVGGSYLTDLMYGPDIDITIATENPREAVVKALNEIINNKICQKYQYGDFETYPRENRPQDHILVLILPFKNRQWEIEIWFTKNHYPEQIELEEKLKNLPLETKEKILELKANRDNSGIDKHTLSSFKIYKDFV
jgi:L-rhamnose isomerase